jgi:hypothetical protein
MPDVGFIYGLRDPETLELRYVGQTIGAPERRRDGHVNGSTRSRTRCAAWIRTLPAAPIVTVFETVPRGLLDDRERWWIAAMRASGANLTNNTPGGASSHAQNAGRNGGLALKGKPKSPEHRAKLYAANLGKKRGPLSEETRRKIGDANRRPCQRCADGACAQHTPEQGRLGAAARWGVV